MTIMFTLPLRPTDSLKRSEAVLCSSFRLWKCRLKQRAEEELQLIAPIHSANVRVTDWSVGAESYGKFLDNNL